MSLDDDLARWEAGAVTVDDLMARHGEAGVSGLLIAHRHLSQLADTPTPDPYVAWMRVVATLPPRAPRWGRVRKLIAGGVAVGVIGVPSMAFAASSGPLHDVVQHLGTLFGDDPPELAPPREGGPGVARPVERERQEPSNSATTSTSVAPNTPPEAGVEIASNVPPSAAPRPVEQSDEPDDDAPAPDADDDQSDGEHTTVTTAASDDHGDDHSNGDGDSGGGGGDGDESTTATTTSDDDPGGHGDRSTEESGES